MRGLRQVNSIFATLTHYWTEVIFAKLPRRE